MVAAGIDVKTAQARLGHADPRQTLGIYAQATNAADRDAADLMGSAFMARPGDRMCHESAMDGATPAGRRPKKGG